MSSITWPASISSSSAARVLHTLPPSSLSPALVTASLASPPTPLATKSTVVGGMFSILTVPNAPYDPTAAMLSAFAATTTSIAVATTTIASPAAAGGPKEKPNGECRLLGPFALLVQGALGLLALLSLVWKRYREHPQRPLLIWWYDASKQVFGSVLVHIANLLMSMLSSGQFSVETTVDVASDGYRPNPCSFYLINLAIDTTIGIAILIPLVRLFTKLVAFTPLGQPPESIQSGNYGRPPKVSWWLKQSVIYFCGLMGMKVCVLIMFTVLPWISRVGDWALRWTEGNEKIQVAFVMLLFPLIMNALQYYIIDGYIKGTNSEGMMQIPDEDSDDEHARHHDYDDAHDSIRADSWDEDVLKPSANTSMGTTARKEYDPALDGEPSPGQQSGETSTSRS